MHIGSDRARHAPTMSRGLRTKSIEVPRMSSAGSFLEPQAAGSDDTLRARSRLYRCARAASVARRKPAVATVVVVEHMRRPVHMRAR